MNEILEFSALILGLVNGLWLLRTHLLDRPILRIHPIHPDVYQWWFRLPDVMKNGNCVRRYGFLVYVGISNSGLRKVQLSSWRMFIRIHAQKKMEELIPITISEPILRTENNSTKMFQVLGTKGIAFDGSTVVEAGCSISGWAYYSIGYYGDDKWNPIIKDQKIDCFLEVRDVFNGKSKTKITLSYKDLNWIKSWIPTIEEVSEI